MLLHLRIRDQAFPHCLDRRWGWIANICFKTCSRRQSPDRRCAQCELLNQLELAIVPCEDEIRLELYFDLPQLRSPRGAILQTENDWTLQPYVRESKHISVTQLAGLPDSLSEERDEPKQPGASEPEQIGT
jgi:hypothetical protein